MGTDLAWSCLNTSRVQRPADAAALGGVVWLPNETGTANSTAHSIATQNGYEDGVDNAVVTPAPVRGEANQLQVTIRDTVPTFFLKVMGFDTMDMSRTAIAEYIPPLKLGSPSNQFGNACDPEYEGNPGFPADCGDIFWANSGSMLVEDQLCLSGRRVCQRHDHLARLHDRQSDPPGRTLISSRWPNL